jgi:hypothetical protein
MAFLPLSLVIVALITQLNFLVRTLQPRQPLCRLVKWFAVVA